MDSRPGSSLERAAGSFNVAGTTACKSRDYGAPNLSCQRPNRVEVPFRRDGKSCLDDVHSQAVELVPHAYLLFTVHAAPRRLLAIAQCGVEYGDVVWLCLICFNV